MRMSSATVYKDNARAALGRKKWAVLIPARLSPTGKRMRKFFDHRQEAEQYAALYNANAISIGASIATVSQADIETITKAKAILEGKGVSIIGAAHAVAELIEQFGSLDKARKYAVRGAGMEQALPAITLWEALEAMNREKETHQSPHTLATRTRRFSMLFTRCPSLPGTILGELTPALIRQSLDAAFARNPSTWNGTYRELSALCSYALEREWIQTNPFDKLKNKRVEEREIIPLHPKQLRALLQACRPPNDEEKAHATRLRKLIADATKPNATAQDKKDAATVNHYELKLAYADTSELALYIALMAFAGVRPEEGKRLTWSDISLEDNVVSIRARKSKTGGARHIKIRPCLRAWILAAEPNRHQPTDPVVPPENLKFKMAALRRRAGFGSASTPWQSDALRHTFASMAIKAGEALEKVQADMGHTTTQLLASRYLNMAGLTKALAKEYWGITPTN